MAKAQTNRLTPNVMEGAPDTSWLSAITTSVNFLNDFVDKSAASENGLSITEAKDVEIQEITIKTPDPWHKFVLINTWADAGGSGYMKHDDGTVEIRLNITGGTDPTFSTMPAGYAPDRTLRLAAWDVTTVLGSYLDVLSTGSISCQNKDTTKACVTYLASDSNPVPLSCWPKMVKTKIEKVIGVVVVDAKDDKVTKPLPTRSGNVIWEMSSVNGVNQVKLLNIPWLPYNRSCKLKLLIFGG